MKKIPMYIALERYDTFALSQAVNEYIRKGWKPQGGVSAFKSGTGSVYVQALIKKELE
jgi:hypothetical protein